MARWAASGRESAGLAGTGRRSRRRARARWRCSRKRDHRSCGTEAEVPPQLPACHEKPGLLTALGHVLPPSAGVHPKKTSAIIDILDVAVGNPKGASSGTDSAITSS